MCIRDSPPPPPPAVSSPPLLPTLPCPTDHHQHHSQGTPDQRHHLHRLPVSGSQTGITGRSGQEDSSVGDCPQVFHLAVIRDVFGWLQDQLSVLCHVASGSRSSSASSMVLDLWKFLITHAAVSCLRCNPSQAVMGPTPPPPPPPPQQQEQEQQRTRGSGEKEAGTSGPCCMSGSRLESETAAGDSRDGGGGAITTPKVPHGGKAGEWMADGAREGEPAESDSELSLSILQKVLDSIAEKAQEKENWKSTLTDKPEQASKRYAVHELISQMAEQERSRRPRLQRLPDSDVLIERASAQ
ncbi:hypothetical protein CBR_g70514, partial [Chara braunii]